MLRDEHAMIDGSYHERKVGYPAHLQQQAPDKLHSNHVGIEKARILMKELICWININTDIENTIKIAQYALDSNRCNPNTK